ncbi:MAG: hypothetical protein V4447_10725 [Pseudomonadota bacterium]
MNFYQTITAAIQDIEAHGFDSQERIDAWLVKIDVAVRQAMLPEPEMRKILNRTMHDIYTRMIDKGAILKMHPGIPPFRLEQVKPSLRAELDRRIMSSAQLIKLNREQMVTKTLQRFSGWSTSIPAGGSKVVDTADVKNDLRKALRQLPFEERRVAIDQGHKFTASLNDILAVDGGAIAAEWHSHWRQPGYNYREDHKERDKLVYLIRGNWAQQQGLCKRGKNGYTDEITMVGEDPFCRCSYSYIYSLRGLPEEMLTNLGREKLKSPA